ncbi:MAG: hypothetical protein RLZZ344_1406 [Pseudomonadota bacterium]|jgi:TrmH family RNA methyltransferase
MRPFTPHDRVISSQDNPQVKALRRLIAQPRVRRHEGRCWVEGPRMVSAALDRAPGSPWSPELVCVGVEAESRYDGRHQRLVEAAVGQGAGILWLDAAVFRGLSDVEADQGVALVLARPEGRSGVEVVPSQLSGDWVILDGLQDPGNVGTLIRTAAAAGVGQVLLTEGTAEAFSPKALRAGAGAQFSLPVLESLRLSSIRDIVVAQGARLALTMPPGGPGVIALFDAEAQAQLSDPRPLAWVLGQEGQGVSAGWAESAAGTSDLLRLTIPQSSGVESLNVTAAAAVFLFERFRCCRKER